MFGLLTLILIKLDFFKRELTDYDRKLIEDSTASNSLVDQQCNELLDRHLNRQFTASTNYLQRGRLLRKHNLLTSVSKDKVDGKKRIRRQTIHHEYHNELASSGGELQSSTYEEYRHLEEEDLDEDDTEQCEESESPDTNNSPDSSNSRNSENSNDSDENSDQSDEQTDSNETDESDEDENEDTYESSRDQRSDIVYERRKINRTTRRVIYEPAREHLAKNSSHSVGGQHGTPQQRSQTNKYNEKLYDKVHYRKNKKYYTFYRDTNYHEPTCPLYSSRRSLVSYR